MLLDAETFSTHFGRLLIHANTEIPKRLQLDDDTTSSPLRWDRWHCSSWRELEVVLRMALDSGKAVALELTIYNPNLDRGGKPERKLSSVLARALGTHAAGRSTARRGRPGRALRR